MAEPRVPPFGEIIRRAEASLEEFGDSTRGVGYSPEEAETHYRVMLDVIRPRSSPVTLLDFGCGLSHLYEYILRHGLTGIQYSGLDISRRFLEISKRKFPDVHYYDVDILNPAAAELPPFDYVVINGVFTYMGCTPHEAKFDLIRKTLRRVFDIARIGIAFNVMSKQVEWERDDLFHLPFDPLANFLSRHLSRHFVIRHDYGLYEYTTYVYKEPSAPEQAGAKMRLNG